jgi:TatA/E family protein of Tat protein translocase
VYLTGETIVTILAWVPGPFEMAVIAALALLLFGRRLPEVGRSLGKGIVEFKKGLNDVGTDVAKSVDESARAESPEQEVARLKAEIERLKTNNKPSSPPVQN